MAPRLHDERAIETFARQREKRRSPAPLVRRERARSPTRAPHTRPAKRAYGARSGESRGRRGGHRWGHAACFEIGLAAWWAPGRSAYPHAAKQTILHVGGSGLPECPSCRRPTESSWRYCAWCAAPQRLKLVEYFRPHPLIERDRARALRVSRYLGTNDDERHVRFSVWHEEGQSAEADAAVSLAEDEAGRLARFLLNAKSDSSAPREGGTRSVLARRA